MHQKIAREMNLSETAFIRKLQPTDNFTQSKYAFFFFFFKPFLHGTRSCFSSGGMVLQRDAH